MNVLEIRNLRAGYGRMQILHGIDLEVPVGGITVLLGANGAGKTTTLRSVCGMVKATGLISFDGNDLLGKKPDRIARRGLAHAAEGRGTFTDLTVGENLLAGAYRRKRDGDVAKDLEKMYNLWPRLRERRNQKASTLSGGEQQMLAVGRALMNAPKLLLLDEPSLGLAPTVVDELYDTLRTINNEMDISMLIVEQNAALALEIADQAYVLATGEIAVSGPASQVREDTSIQAAYLGF